MLGVMEASINFLIVNTFSRTRQIQIQILDLPNYQLCYIKHLLNYSSLSSLIFQNENNGS